MSSNSAASTVSNQYLRIDPEHHVLEMMRQALQRMPSRRLDVQLLKDRVLLTGTVTTRHDKQNIQEKIRGLSGSREIHNELQVCES